MTLPEQRRGEYPKLVAESDIGAKEVHAISDITTKK